MREHSAAADMKRRFEELASLLAEPGASTRDRMRVRLAVVALHLGAFVGSSNDASDEERHTAALSLARELAGV